MNKKILIFFILTFILFFSPVLNAEEDYYLNLDVEIPSDQKQIEPNMELWFTTKIVLFNNEETRDIQLTYILLTDKRREIAKKTETVAIQTQASFVGGILIPEDARDGIHTLQVQVQDPSGGVIFTEKDFTIIKEKYILEEIKDNLLLYIILTLLIISGIVFLTLKKKISKGLEKMKFKSQINSIINSKIKNKEITKEELKKAKLKEKKIEKEEEIF